MITSPKIIDCEQGSDAWRKARVGIPTASRFTDMMAEGRGLSRGKYLRQLAAEHISGRPMETYQSASMVRGQEQEPIIRSEYEFMTNTRVELIGFITNGKAGVSPDGKVAGTKGAVEFKSALPDILIDIMLRETFPAEHKAQCQGTLYVGEFEWIDLVVGCPGMPLYIRRAFPDVAYIRELDREVDRFNRDLKVMIAKVRSYRR